MKEFFHNNHFLRQVIFFSQVIIKFDKLGSAYESNMENAVIMELPITVGLGRQQHDA